MTDLCFECSQTATHQHHVIPECMGGTRKVWLCEACHKKVHAPGEMLSLGSLSRISAALHGRKPRKMNLEKLILIMQLKGKVSIREAGERVGVSHATIDYHWRGKGTMGRTLAGLKRVASMLPR